MIYKNILWPCVVASIPVKSQLLGLGQDAWSPGVPGQPKQHNNKIPSTPLNLYLYLLGSFIPR